MSHLLPRYHRRQLAREDAVAVDKAVGYASDEPSTQQAPRLQLAKPGDPRVLRAIPVIARGVGGAIPGSNPLTEAMRLNV